MKLNLLPVAERELRVVARGRRTLWTRLLPVIVAILMAFWSLLSVGGTMPAGQIGANLFAHLSIFVLVASLLMGPILTADCLSKEKREGTLGLLFLTDLNRHDVTFGKLLGTSVNALYSLLAILPVLAIPLLLGGVTGGEYWRVAAALLNALWFSLALGLLVSALCKQEYIAMGLTAVLVATAGVLLPILGAASKVRWLEWLADQFSPALTWRAALASHYQITPWSFYTSLLLVHLTAWACLLASTRALARTWGDEILWRRFTPRWPRWRHWALGNAKQLQSYRTRLLERNPAYWLGSRNRLHNLHLWLITFAAIGIWWVGCLMTDWRYLKDAQLTNLSIMGVHLVLKCLMASEAARRLANDRECGILSIVLGSRLTVKEILQGQILTLRRQFAGPVALVLLWDIVVFVAASVRLPFGNALDLGLFVAIVLVLLCDLTTLAWVGLWLGFKTQKPAHATLGTLLRVLCLPSIFAPFLVVGSRLSNAAFLWFFISAIFDGVFMLYAWMKLHDEFRFQLTEVPPKPSDYDEDFALLKWSSVERRQPAAV